MKSNVINSNLQPIDFEKRSAIIQCHVNKNRLWILNKNGDFDYYSEFGHEPTLHISIDKNVTPKRLWPNQRGTRFIVETIDFSLYYFQTSDLTAHLFYPTQSIGMTNFFRIGALKNGPVSTIYFDDNPEDPLSTKQIFIVVKGGGILVLSIDTLQDKETEEQTTMISDFETFPTLFTDLNILDMKIFRIIERQSNTYILNEIKEKAKEIKNNDSDLIMESNVDKSLKYIQDYSELYEILIETKKQIFSSQELIDQFRNLYGKLQDEQATETQQQTDTIQIKKSSSKLKNNEQENTVTNNTNSSLDLLSEVENFIKVEKNMIKDIDMNYNIKISNNPNLLHPNFSVWLDCVENMKLVEKETDTVITNTYKTAHLYQQLDQLVSNGFLKNIDKIYNDLEDESNEETNSKSYMKNSNEEDSNSTQNKENKNHTEEEEENIENEEDFEFDLDFNLDFYFDDKKKKKKKEKKKKEKEKEKKEHKIANPKDKEVLQMIKSSLFQIIEDLRAFLNDQKINKKGKLTEVRKMITVQFKRIKEMGKSIISLQQKLDHIFHKINFRIHEFSEDYMIDRNKQFHQNEDDETLTPYLISKLNKNVVTIIDMLKQRALFNISFSQSIESFCKFAQPFFEDTNMEKENDIKYNIIRTYLIFLAEDRIVRSSSKKKPIDVLRKIKRKKRFEFIFNEMGKSIIQADPLKFPFTKIDTQSRLVHKPLKVSPSHKRPTFYFVVWDSEKSVNICCSFKFKQNQKKKKKNMKDENNKKNLNEDTNILYKLEIKQKNVKEVKETFLIKQVKKFEFEPEMRINFYQITPSGLIVVQSSERADSKAVAYEISSLIPNDTNVSSSQGKMLWYQEITDYLLLPILNCDFCVKTGLIIYNSMKIKIISRKNVDLQSFNALIRVNDSRTIKKVRRYLALTPQQKNETFYILLVYAMNQLFQRESSYQIKKHQRRNKEEKDEKDDQNELKNVDFSLLSKLIFEAREALTKLLNKASCSKMSIFLFLMDDKKLNEKINFCLTSDNNDGRLFERFRRFRIEFLVSMLDSIDSKMKRQQEALLLMALDLIMQCFSTRNNKNIYVSDSTVNSGEKSDKKIESGRGFIEDDAQMTIYFKKCFTGNIGIDDITSLTKKYGSSLLSLNCAYYILKSFPVLDSPSFFRSESESNVEVTFSKVYKFLVLSSESTFMEAGKSLINFINNYQDNLQRIPNSKNDKKTIALLSNNSEEIDFMINRLLLYGIEKHNDKNWFIVNFSNFFNDLENLAILPQIPMTILSLFIFLRTEKENKQGYLNYEPFVQFDPVINYMKSYYEKENKKDQVDLLFSLFVSMEKLKEIEALRKRRDYNITLAIYRCSLLRVHAAKLLEDVKMTSVAIDVVLDERSASTAIKFASSLKNENTMLYLVRTASRRRESLFNSIYNNAVDKKLITSSNRKLYDILVCIPDDKLIDMESLLENIFKTLESIDNKSNEELKKIKTLQEKMKPMSNFREENSVVTSPFSLCDFCHNSVLEKDFFLFPCGHVFHKKCFELRSLRDQIDRENMLLFHPNSQKFTTNANQCLCPLCGLPAVELIDTPMYALLEDEDVQALRNNNIGYIMEDDTDDYDYSD